MDLTTGVITTLAGDGAFGFSGDEGPAISATLNEPVGVAVDGGDLFIADFGNHRIRKVDLTTGIISTVAGNGTPGFSGDGGPATSASLETPNGVAVDTSGNLFIADKSNSRIRRVDATSGIISTVAGVGSRFTNFTKDHGSDNFDPVWCPDGRRIAFISNRDGNDELYVKGIDGREPTNLSKNPGLDARPAWSPDGEFIAFISDRSDGDEQDIYVVRGDGTEQTNLTNNPGHRCCHHGRPVWSPNGEYIAFGIVSDEYGKEEIYVIRADGTELTNLSNTPFYHEGRPAWSPDSSKIAFDSDRDGTPDIYLMNADGSNQTRLTQFSQSGCDPLPQPFRGDDFETGDLANWCVVRGGEGSWFVYDDGDSPPDPFQSDPHIPFDVPDPPQGRFAAVTDMDGPGTRILFRNLELDDAYMLRLTIFYVNLGAIRFWSPDTLAHHNQTGEANQQFRIDLIDPSAPIDSLVEGDVLANIFRTSPGDPHLLEPTTITFDLSPWEGQTVRIRLATTDNQGPLRAGVDDIRLEAIQR